MKHNRVMIVPIVLAIMLCVSIPVLSAGETGPSEHDQSADFALENGLRILTMQDRSCPLISVVVRVGAGSAYETSETSGLSHLLEHLLFDGTIRRSAREIQDVLDAHGAYLNAFTRQDYTVFEAVVPPEQIELAFELLSDMLFFSVFPQEQLEKERKVVIEEIRKDLDNPYSVCQDIFYRRLFRATPYEYPIIGSEYTVLNLSRDTILDHYRTYYRPDNMTLIAVGDFDSESVSRLSQRYFGRIPASSPGPGPDLSTMSLSAGVYHAQAQVKNIFCSMALAGPAPEDEAAIAFEVLSRILTSPETGPLVMQVKKAGIDLLDTWGSYNQFRGFGFLELGYLLEPGSEQVNELITQISRILNDFPLETISAVQVERMKTTLRADLLYEKEKFVHYARWIAHNDAVNAQSAWRSYEQKLEQVDLETVRNAFDHYLRGSALMCSIVRPYPSSTGTGADLELHTVKKTYANGLTLIVRENKTLPIAGLNVLIKNRSLSEKSPGLAHCVSSMLDSGTRMFNRTEIQNRLDDMGGHLQLTDNPYFPFDDYYFVPEYSYLRLEFLADHWAEALELVKELLFQASFPSSEFESTRNRLLSLVRMSGSSPSSQARHLFYKTVFDEHPFARPLIGSIESITALSRGDVVEHYQRIYRPGNMIFSLVGDVDAQSLIEKAGLLFDDFYDPLLTETVSRQPTPVQSIVRVEEKTRGEQASIYLGNIVQVNESDEAALIVLFAIINERLQQSVREEHGLAYSVSAGLHLGNQLDWYAFSASTGPTTVEQVVLLMEKVLSELKQPAFTQDELTRAIYSETGRSVRYRQRRINQAHFLTLAEFMAGGYENDEAQDAHLKAVTIPDLLRVSPYIGGQAGHVIAVCGPTMTP